MIFVTFYSDKLFDIVCTRAVKTLIASWVELRMVSSEAEREICGEMTLDSAEGLGAEEPQRM